MILGVFGVSVVSVTDGPRQDVTDGRRPINGRILRGHKPALEYRAKFGTLGTVASQCLSGPDVHGIASIYRGNAERHDGYPDRGGEYDAAWNDPVQSWDNIRLYLAYGDNDGLGVHNSRRINADCGGKFCYTGLEPIPEQHGWMVRNFDNGGRSVYSLDIFLKGRRCRWSNQDRSKH